MKVLSHIIIYMLLATDIMAQDLHVDEILPQIHADMIPNVESPVRLSFKSRVEIETSTVFLGDLIEKCESIDNVCTIISHLEVGSAPDLGKSSIVRHSSLREIMLKNYPSLKPEFENRGSSTLYSKFYYVDKSQFSHVIDEFFENVSNDNERYKVYSFRIERPVRSRTKKLNFSVEKSSDLGKKDERFSRNKSTNLTIIGNSIDGLSERIKVNVKIFYELKRKLPVAIKEVRRGQRIFRDNFDYKWVKITDDFITNLSDLDGKQAKRRLLVGRPVRYKDIQRELLVKRGKVKEIGISSSGIIIVTPARVLDNGSAGESVRVKVLKTKKILTGIVKRDGSVEVNL